MKKEIIRKFFFKKFHETSGHIFFLFIIGVITCFSQHFNTIRIKHGAVDDQAISKMTVREITANFI